MRGWYRCREWEVDWCRNWRWSTVVKCCMKSTRNHKLHCNILPRTQRCIEFVIPNRKCMLLGSLCCHIRNGKSEKEALPLGFGVCDFWLQIPAVADWRHCGAPIPWNAIMISHTSNKLISCACILFDIAQEITRLYCESWRDASSGQRYARTKRNRERTACCGGIYYSRERTTSKMRRRSEKWGNRNRSKWTTRWPLKVS